MRCYKSSRLGHTGALGCSRGKARRWCPPARKRQRESVEEQVPARKGEKKQERKKNRKKKAYSFFVVVLFLKGIVGTGWSKAEGGVEMVGKTEEKEKKERWHVPSGERQKESAEMAPTVSVPREYPSRPPNVCQIKCLSLRPMLLRQAGEPLPHKVQVALRGAASTLRPGLLSPRA